MQLSNLLQSNEWESFEKAQGNQTFWIDDNLFVKNNLPRGKSYLFCPRGPKELTEDFIKTVKKLAKKEKSIFVRIEPLQEIKKTIKQKIKKTKDINPANTLVLDLSLSEEQLLSNMKQKARYNLNLAKKKGVVIEKTTNSENAKIFYEIAKETSARDKFGVHSKKHYKNLLETFGPKRMMVLYLARYEGKYIAANLVSFFGNTVSYLHGASANEYRNVMAPYLLQWQAILDAKKEGYQYYDFWGIAPDDNPSHKWAGVTRFKKGFGGEQLNYPGTYDLVISKSWYAIYKVMRFLNRIF